MNWYTRRRSLKPSLTSWTRPSPKCPDTKKQQPHCVHFTTNKLRQQATRPVVSTTRKLRWGLACSEPLASSIHSSILFLPETRADNVPKNISFYFFRFCGTGSKRKLYKAKKSITLKTKVLPPYPPPHHKIKIMRLFNENVPNLPSLKILTLLPTHRRH